MPTRRDRLLALAVATIPVIHVWFDELIVTGTTEFWVWGAWFGWRWVFHAWYYVLFAVCWLAAYRLLTKCSHE